MAWHVAKSLLVLREQIDRGCPNRSKASDGTIGDTAHQSQGSDSDHNPWYNNTVTALDVTHDPGHGMDIDKFTDQLQASRDKRIKYVIANALIMSGAGGPSPWVWRSYGGSDPHRNHAHISVVASPACEDPTPWNIPMLGSSAGIARMLFLTTPMLRGADVTAVQRKLGIGADGWFGPQTDAAVRAFQRNHGLVSDGVVGPITRHALGL